MTVADVVREAPGVKTRVIATITADLRPDDAARWLIELADACERLRVDPQKHHIRINTGRRYIEHRPG